MIESLIFANKREKKEKIDPLIQLRDNQFA